MGWGKGLSENGESYRKIGYGIMFIVLLSLLSLDCHRPPPENEQQYDPRNISRTETQSVGPSIALSPDGTVYVVWMDGSENGYEPFHIYFKYKSADNGWSEPEVISDITTDSWEPHAIVDPFGNLHVVWREQDPDITKAKIYYRMRSSTGEWSDIGVLSGEGALQPRIAVDPSGTVHVVWSAGALWYTYKPPEGGWATPREVVLFAIAGDNPCLTVDSDGNCHLVYEHSGEIYYVTGSPTGEWSEPFNVSQSKYTSWLGHVTVDEEERVYVLWTEEDWGAGPQTSNNYRGLSILTRWSVLLKG